MKRRKNKRIKTRKGKRDNKYTLIYFGGWDLTNWEKKHSLPFLSDGEA